MENKSEKLSPELLAQVFQDAADPIIIENLQGVIIEMNNEAERAYGWSRDDLVGKPIKTIVPPDRHHQADSLLERCRNGENIRNVEGYRWNRNRQLFPVLLSLFPIKDCNRNTVAVATISKNIAEQKKVENDLKNITSVFHSILNNVSICVNTINRNGIIVQSTGSGLLKMGFHENQLVGSSFFNHYPDGEELLHRALQGETVTFLQSGEYDGNNFFFQHTLFPREDVTEGVVSIGVDITELRELQRQVISASEDERENIGRELHDELGQVLTGIGYLMRAIEEKISDGKSIDPGEVSTISGLVGKALDQTRNLSRGLSRIQMQQDFSLALEEIIAELEQLYGVECDVSKSGDIRIADNNVATHLYYILKESVHNAMKHGISKNVSIRLNADANLFTLVVENKGNFCENSAEISPKGLGLRIMRYRADILGAHFFVDAKQEHFTVTLVMDQNLLD